MSILPKVIYRLNAIPIKIPIVYLTDLEQIFKKFRWNHNRPQIDQQSREKRTKLEVAQYLISNYTTRS